MKILPQNLSFKADVSNDFFKTKPGEDFNDPDNYTHIGNFTATIEAPFDTFQEGDTIKLSLWKSNSKITPSLVAADQGRKIGRCFFFDHNEIEISDLANHEDGRVKGVGPAFFQYFAELCLKLQKQLSLTAFNENENPVEFYNRIGLVAENDSIQ